MLRLSRIIPIAAAALVLGALACDRSGPTGPNTVNPPALDIVKSTDQFACNQVINPVTGEVSYQLQTLAGENLRPELNQLGNLVCASFVAGNITPNEFNGLSAKLFAASAALERGQIGTFVNIMNAFINQSQAIFVNRNCNGTEVSGVCHDLNQIINEAQRVLGGIT